MIINIREYVTIFFIGKKSTKLVKLLSYINLSLFHRDLKYRKKCYGQLNLDKTFLIIRPTSNAEGLLSLFFTVMRNVLFAEENGMIPIVDYKNYSTQYSGNNSDSESINVWEEYFLPVSKYTLDEVYKSKNVYVTGWGRPILKNNIFMNDYSEKINEQRHDFICAHTGVSAKVSSTLAEYIDTFRDSAVLGVFVRGTDYVKLKPIGHPIQPLIEDVIEKVEEFITKKTIDKIFIVTEDYNVYLRFQERFGGLLFSIDNNYVKDYMNGYVYNNIHNLSPYEKGLVYLQKMLLLNECKYIVATLTNGSLFTLAMKEGEFEDKYIYNLGKY